MIIVVCVKIIERRINLHQVESDQDWIHFSYAGEDRDDNCKNELSLQPDPKASRLNLLLSNHGFNDEPHDGTFALTKTDAQALNNYLTWWLEQQ